MVGVKHVLKASLGQAAGLTFFRHTCGAAGDVAIHNAASLEVLSTVSKGGRTNRVCVVSAFCHFLGQIMAWVSADSTKGRQSGGHKTSEMHIVTSAKIKTLNN
jgi:hypothetical protein